MDASVRASLDLLTQFNGALDSTDPSIEHVLKDPLTTLENSANLTKAHTTKLSLLLINKPFTPTAITTVIRHLNTSTLPMMVRAAVSCSAAQWGTIFCKEVRNRVRRILREIRELLNEVPKEDDTVVHLGTGRDSLASTGIVWAACDSLVALKRLGLGGLLAQKALEQQEMLQDAITELDDWSKEPPSPPTSDDEQDHSDDEGQQADDGHQSLKEMDLLFTPNNSLPQGATKLRDQLSVTLKRLKTIEMLFKAVTKRRLLTLSSPTRPVATDGVEEEDATEGVPADRLEKLDEVMHDLEAISSEADELAQAFYELNEEEASAQLQKCTALAVNVSRLVEKSWDGREDAFSAWVTRWREVVAEPTRAERD